MAVKKKTRVFISKALPKGNKGATYADLFKKYCEESRFERIKKLRYNTIIKPVLIDGMSERQLEREYGISRKNIRRILEKWRKNPSMDSLAYKIGRPQLLSDDQQDELCRVCDQFVLRYCEARGVHFFKVFEKSKVYRRFLKRNGLDGMSRSCFYNIIDFKRDH